MAPLSPPHFPPPGPADASAAVAPACSAAWAAVMKRGSVRKLNGRCEEEEEGEETPGFLGSLPRGVVWLCARAGRRGLAIGDDVVVLLPVLLGPLRLVLSRLSLLFEGRGGEGERVSSRRVC